MYGNLAAILTDKLQKGSVVDSIHESSPVMEYPGSCGQQFAKTPMIQSVASVISPQDLPLTSYVGVARTLSKVQMARTSE
jgi:hypothetical protein